MHLFLKGKVPFIHYDIVPKYFVTKYFWHNFDGRWNIHQLQSAQKMGKRVQKYRLACLPNYAYIPPKNWISTLFLHSARREGHSIEQISQKLSHKLNFFVQHYAYCELMDGFMYWHHTTICTSKTLLTIMSLSLAKLY